MTRVNIREDCGNSPKNIFVQEITVAFAKGDMKLILGSVTDDFCWNVVGAKQIQGKADFAGALEESKSNPAAELTIHHIATHGKAGAVDGTIKFKNGKIWAFCDVYEFSNSKGASVKEITSYRIEIR